MGISLLRILLLRFFKTFHIYLANAILCNFANAILWLMRIFGYFISLVRFFGLIWLIEFFPKPKVALGKNPL